MGIMRVAKNANYTVMNRTALNDTRLSWKAKGIIAYMLSMPDDWIFYIDELIKHSTDGKAAFNGGFKELKDCGYVERRPIKDEKTKKITSWETIVHEVPYEPQTEKPVSGKTTDWKTSEWETSHMENHALENQTLLSTDSNQVLNIPNTNRLLNTDNYQQETAATTVGGSGSLIDSQFVEILNRIEQNTGPLTPFQSEELGYIYDQYGYELTNEASKTVLLTKDVRKPLAYLERILQSWRSKGISSLQNLKLYRERGESYGTSIHGNRGSSQKNEGTTNPYEIARNYCSE